MCVRVFVYLCMYSARHRYYANLMSTKFNFKVMLKIVSIHSWFIHLTIPFILTLFFITSLDFTWYNLINIFYKS